LALEKTLAAKPAADRIIYPSNDRGEHCRAVRRAEDPITKERETVPLKEGDETLVFENVRVTDGRDMDKRANSVICTFPDDCPTEWLRNLEKPIPRSQVPEGFEFPGDGGTGQDEEFEVEVSAWIVQQWEDEPFVKISGVEVLREVEGKYGPQLKIRLASGATDYVGLKGLHHKNQLARQGDKGDLLLFGWLAEKKGWKGDGQEADYKGGGGKEGARKQAAPKGGAPRPAANVGQDARGGAPASEDDEDPPPF
jgi:hypothetical protein